MVPDLTYSKATYKCGMAENTDETSNMTVISKILVNRLAKVISSIIGSNQTVFIVERQILDGAASGLKINLDKSGLFNIGVAIDDVNVVASSLGCSHDVPPFSYLGLPIGKRMRFYDKWMSLNVLDVSFPRGKLIPSRRLLKLLVLLNTLIVVSFEALRNPNLELVRPVIKEFLAIMEVFVLIRTNLRVKVLGATFLGLPR
nr:arginine repressor C-terminal-like domain-containing protein [Tanacetum cinerariifolium]